MTSFSIDDVRETMRADVCRFLSCIDDDASQLLSASIASGDGTNLRLREIGEAGHAIFGTSALVAAESLAASAALIEKLAERAEQELQEAERHRERARLVVALCAEGAQEMRAMLDLELDHQTEEAQLIALAWQRKAEDRLGSPSCGPTPAPPPRIALEVTELESGQSREPSEVLGDDEFPFDGWEQTTKPSASLDPASQSAAASEAVLPAAVEELDDGWDLGGEPEQAAPSQDAPPSAAAAEGPAAAAADDSDEFRLELDEGSADSGDLGAGAADADADAQEFDFEEQVPTAELEIPGLSDELAQIFAQEAREHLIALQGYLSALSADHSDLSVASQIERLFHTLKGASATVGLEAVSTRAAELQQRMERVVEQGHVVDRAFMTELLRDTNSLLQDAGLPQVTITVVRTAAKRRANVAGEEERAVFVEEARQICVDVQKAMEELATAPEAQRGALIEELERAFHRLKGSALVVGDQHVADQASTLEAACGQPGAPTTAELSRGLAKIMASLGLGRALLGGDQEDGRNEARAVFVEEARELFVEARALIREYADTSGSRMDELRLELGRVFHRLKGSAAVVAEDALALEAGLLQRLCEEPTSGSPSPVALKVGLTRLSQLLGVELDDRTSQLTFDVGGPVREAVQIAAEPGLWEAFTQECSDLLETLDRDILTLEESDSPKDQLQSLLRTYHTLKGVVNTIGLAPTGRVLHRVEDFVEGLLAAPVLPAPSSIASFLLQVQVEVRRNLKQARQGFVETSLARLESRAARVLAGRRVSASSSVALSDSQASQRGRSTRESAQSAPGGAWSDTGSGRTDQKFIRVAIDRLDTLMNLAGELVVSRSRLMSRVQRLRDIQQEIDRSGRRLLETVETFCEDYEFANLDGAANGGRDVALSKGWSSWVASAAALKGAQTHDESSDAPGATEGAQGWSAFGELELDRYGDVHILSRSLAEITSDFDELYKLLGSGLSTLTDDSDAFDAIVSGIQSEVTRARMVPVESLFSRLRLPARDAAVREAKAVRVVSEGEEVNIDKTIADALFQPMLHLVRNSVVHGIEKPGRRESLGKPQSGTIVLSARQESGQIVIEVRDDGRGLDLERLRSRGVALGLVSPDTPADDPTIKDLVFVQGLSTHESAGAVAGRGVGCDVVRRIVERLNGSIRVDTVRGKHTTFVVTLPVTLAITRALLVRHARQLMAVPLHFAERILDLAEHPIVESAGVRRIKVDGSFVPVKQMSSLLGATESGERGPVLVLRVGDQRSFLQVDAVVGQEEVVVKPLGELLAGHPLLAGVTIRGTGELVLILDAPGILDAARGVHKPAAEAVVECVTPELVEPEPVPEPAPVAQPSIAEPAAPRPGQLLERAPHVLFVDDSLSVRKVAESYLKQIGVDVTLAIDGVDALAKLREGHFDLVFTDLEMPRMHGYELLRELRFLPAYRELPIIVVTSRSGQKHQDQAKALGASEYLTKPFTTQHLAGALARWTGFRGTQGSESE